MHQVQHRGSSEFSGSTSQPSLSRLRVQEAQPLMQHEPQLRMSSVLSLAKSDSIVRCASLESKMRSLYQEGADLLWAAWRSRAWSAKPLSTAD